MQECTCAYRRMKLKRNFHFMQYNDPAKGAPATSPAPANRGPPDRLLSGANLLLGLQVLVDNSNCCRPVQLCVPKCKHSVHALVPHKARVHRTRLGYTALRWQKLLGCIAFCLTSISPCTGLQACCACEAAFWMKRTRRAQQPAQNGRPPLSVAPLHPMLLKGIYTLVHMTA